MKKLFVLFFLILICLQLPASAELKTSQNNTTPRYEGMIKNIKIPPSSFIYYIVEGDKATVEKLIEDGADPNFTYMRIPSVFFASYYKQYEILDLLLSNGADINKKCLGITLLDFSVYNLNAESTRIAIDHKADFNIDKEGVEYLGYAIKKNNHELIKLFLDAGVIPDRYCIKKAKKLDDDNLKNLIIQKGEQK